MKILYLCGFMGSGKTLAGKISADKLRIPFVDLDSHIEAGIKKTIPEIFKEHGEDYFRTLETCAIASASEVLRQDFFENKSDGVGGVIALGGGGIIKNENVEIINKFGVSVFIDTNFEVCYERIKNDPNRPIAHEKSRTELETLYKTRKQIYLKNAQHTVDGNTDADTLSEAIISKFNA